MSDPSRRFTETHAIKGSAGDLEVLVSSSAAPPRRPLVVLPNGYGVLSYTRSVVQSFARTRSTVMAVNLRGQGSSHGEFSVPGCVDDIEVVLPHLGKRYGQFDVVAHCSAFLYLLDLPRDSVVWDSISRIVLYAYLAEPEKHVERFVKRARRFGTRFARDLGDLTHYSPELYASLPVPFAVVHPTTPRNLQRASIAQVRRLTEIASPIAVTTPSKGYEIADTPQDELVDHVVNNHFMPALVA